MGVLRRSPLPRVNMPEMERQDSFKSVLRNVKRKLSTRERKQSKQDNDNDRSQLPGSLKCSPFSSNNNTPSRSPFLTPREIDENPKEEPDSQDDELFPVKVPVDPVPVPAAVCPPRSPLPPDSP